MLEFCKIKWSHNEVVLRNALKNMKELNSCSYKDLVRLTVKYILNEDIGIENYDDIKFNLDNIREIDDGEYQGTLMYIIPMNAYQPSPGKYIMTYCYYGSCSVCDTLLMIQTEECDDETRLDAYTTLCRHMVCNIVRPYNSGWFEDEIFKTVEE